MVSALTGPWLESKNPNYIYAANQNFAPNPPVEIDLASRSIAEGDLVEVVCLGGSVDLGSGIYIGDCNGIVSLGLNYNDVWQGNYWPALYFPEIVDSYCGQMLATFVDENGAIIGHPYLVGPVAVQIAVPAGAKKLLFGLNETSYGNDDGSTFLWGSFRKVTAP